MSDALRKALAGINPEQVFLFGSRVDDRARGGDIDVLVFSQADLPQKIKDISAEVVGRMGTELFRVKSACARIRFE